MEEGRSALNILTGKPTEKRPLGRSIHRWEDSIRIDLKEIGINNIRIDLKEIGINNIRIDLKEIGINNIRIDLKEIGINTRNWVDLAQDGDYWIALANVELNLQVP